VALGAQYGDRLDDGERLDVRQQRLRLKGDVAARAVHGHGKHSVEARDGGSGTPSRLRPRSRTPRDEVTLPRLQ
jgi:hypothetical protein